jgi:hypothetical protein
MSELTFTKSFLSMLDSRPIKLRADHVFDPEQIGLRVPVSLDFDILPALFTDEYPSNVLSTR